MVLNAETAAFKQLADKASDQPTTTTSCAITEGAAGATGLLVDDDLEGRVQTVPNPGGCRGADAEGKHNGDDGGRMLVIL